MTKDIIKSEMAPLSSFEEFEKFVYSLDDNDSLLDKSADLYSKIPALLRTLPNFEPTGIAGALAQLLEENKAQREQKNILLAMFELVKVVSQFDYKIKQLGKAYLAEEFPKLTEMYIDHSRQASDISKIYAFRNIWINGLLADDRSSSEKEIAFDIVQSLSEDEINALKFIYDTSKNSDTGRNPHINFNDVAEALSIEPAYAQQLCVRLRTQGLVGESSTGMSFGSGPPVTFQLMEFTDILISYTSDFFPESRTTPREP